MNLYKALIESAPIKARLQFGFNENIILESVDFSVRKNKGMPIKANTFIKLVQVDPETRKAKAAFEGSFWNLDPSSDFAISNFEEQLTTLSSLVESVGGDSMEFVNRVVEQTGKSDEEMEELLAMAKTKDGATLLMKAMQDEFKTQIEGKTGADSPLMKCKLTSNKKGYLGFPNEQDWILPMDSDEELPPISTNAQKIYDASLAGTAGTTATPDSPGEAPGSGEADIATGDLSGL